MKLQTIISDNYKLYLIYYVTLYQDESDLVRTKISTVLTNAFLVRGEC